MRQAARTLGVQTSGAGLVEITGEVAAWRCPVGRRSGVGLVAGNNLRCWDGVLEHRRG